MDANEVVFDKMLPISRKTWKLIAMLLEKEALNFKSFIVSIKKKTIEAKITDLKVKSIAINRVAKWWQM